MPIEILLGLGNPAELQYVQSLVECEDVEVLGAASESPELVSLAVHLQPAVVILGQSMPPTGALEIAREIYDLCPDTHVILLTQHTAEDYVIAAFRSGIRGYVVEDDAAAVLARAIREVSRGRLFMSPSATRGLTEAYLPQAVGAPPEIPQ